MQYDADDLLGLVKNSILHGDRTLAERELQRLVFSRAGRATWQKALSTPYVRVDTLLGFAQHFTLTTRCETVCVNLETRHIYASPEFLLRSRYTDLLFYLLHEKEHVLLYTFFGVLNGNSSLHNTNGQIEDVFVNCRVRQVVEDDCDPTQWYYREAGDPENPLCIQSFGLYAAMRGDFSSMSAVLKRHHAKPLVRILKAQLPSLEREAGAILSRRTPVTKNGKSALNSAWKRFQSLRQAVEHGADAASIFKVSREDVVDAFVETLIHTTADYDTYPLYRLLANTVFQQLRTLQHERKKERVQDIQCLGESEALEDEFPQTEPTEDTDEGAGEQKIQDESSPSDTFEEPGDSTKDEEGEPTSDEDADEESRQEQAEGLSEDEEEDSPEEGTSEGEEHDAEGEDAPEAQDDAEEPDDEEDGTDGDEEETPAWGLWDAEVKPQQYASIPSTTGTTKPETRREGGFLPGMLRGYPLTKIQLNTEDARRPLPHWLHELLTLDVATALNPQRSGEPMQKAIQLIADEIVGTVMSAQESTQLMRRTLSPRTLHPLDLSYLAAGFLPPVYRSPLKLDATRVVLYIDVSPSMEAYYTLVTRVQKMLAENAGMVVQFSTDLFEADANESALYAGQGTDYDALAEYILREGHTDVLVLTDHTAYLSEENIQALGAQLSNLYLISTPPTPETLRATHTPASGAGTGFRELQRRAAAGEFPGLNVVDTKIPHMVP